MTDEELARVHAPIGLPIGSRSPEEVAVAIAAEIISVFNAKTPRVSAKAAAVRREARELVRGAGLAGAGVGAAHGRAARRSVHAGRRARETVDDAHWKADMGVKLGPIALDVRHRRDPSERSTRPAGSVTLTRRRARSGAAAARRRDPVEPDASRRRTTRIDIVTDLTLSGAVAQYGRGIVQDVSRQLVGRFADCLKAQLAAARRRSEAGRPPSRAEHGEAGLGPLAGPRSDLALDRAVLRHSSARGRRADCRGRGSQRDSASPSPSTARGGSWRSSRASSSSTSCGSASA